MLSVQGLHMRAALLTGIRNFFCGHGFLEVDTPVRQPVYIPEANIFPVEAEGKFLQSSPELCMKRLLSRGCSNIFQICPCFRQGERGRNHLEEFLMLEWYRRDSDYRQLMDDCRGLLRYLKTLLEARLKWITPMEGPCFSGIDFEGDWQALTVAEAFEIYCPCDLSLAMANDLFEELLVEHVEPHLGKSRPTFLSDYPVELGSLARRKTDNPDFVERFELYVNTIELANGFTELTDAEEQRQRFELEIEKIHRATGRSVEMPQAFLRDLEHLESAAGIALGLDRLVMLAMNKKEISEAVSFSDEDLR